MRVTATDKRVSTAGAQLLLLLSLLLLGPGATAFAASPNVVLVVIDTLRADRVGAYGYERPTTPGLDNLAQMGVLMRRAYSTTSWTNPAVAGIFTGEFPRVLQPGAARYVAKDQMTLAKAFHDSGYRTAAFVANPVLGPDMGFADGFDVYQGVSGWAKGLEQRPKQAAARVSDAALAWMEKNRGHEPWFLYLHYMDPHWPYEPAPLHLRPFWPGELPKPAQVKTINDHLRQRHYSAEELVLARALYDGAVAQVDAELGKLLGKLNRTSTVVAITADHGEELGDHGDVLHARTLYDEVLQVPLLVLAPNRNAQSIERPVQTSDLGRTLLDLCGLQDRKFPGSSFFAAAPRPLLAALDPAPPSLHRAAVIDNNLKLIATSSEQWLLFDLTHDADELENLQAKDPQTAARLQTLIPSRPLANDQKVTPNAALRERMRALGYDF